MRVIITGGTGLIGRHLAASLISDAHEVVVLSRTPELVKKLPAGVRVVGWDARTLRGWEDLIDGQTAIVNLAGAGIADKRWTDERKAILQESRIHAGQAVTEAVQAASQIPRVVIQASAVGYYGPRQDEIVTEEDSHSPQDNFLAGICRDWEASTQGVEAAGARRVVIRTGVVLSMDGGAFPKMVGPFNFYIGGPIGSGKQWFPWIHIQDEVNAIKFLIHNETTQGVYNLSAPNPLTNAQFGRVIGKVKNRPAVLPMPSIMMEVVFGEMAEVLLTGQRVIPQRLLDAGFHFGYREALPALENLLQKH